MQAHSSAEIGPVLLVCMGIAGAVVLTMLSALLISGNAAKRKKWIPRYIIVSSILAVLFCAVTIFSESLPVFLSVCKLALGILVIVLWATTAAGLKWCDKCGERMTGRPWEKGIWAAMRTRFCTNCAAKSGNIRF